MEGDGRYNAHSYSQAVAARCGLRELARAATGAPVPPSGVVTIADYGASQGRNSLAPMTVAIDALHDAHGPELTIEVVHTDLPDNDFTTLFQTVRDDAATYAADRVFTLAAGRSFYEQLLPAGSVSLGWSATALHWLSAAPAGLPPGIWPNGTASPAREMWRAAAAADWQTFLDCRAAELAPGARLVVVSPAAGPDGRSGAGRVIGLIDDALRAMVGAGSVSQAEYEAMTIPAWYRTAAEWKAAFPRPDLELESCGIVPLGDPFWERWAERGDMEAYATLLAASLRSSFGPALLAPIGADRRTPTLDELFDHRLSAAIAQAPRAVSPNWSVALLVISRPAT